MKRINHFIPHIVVYSISASVVFRRFSGLGAGGGTSHGRGGRRGCSAALLDGQVELELGRQLLFGVQSIKEALVKPKIVLFHLSEK